MKKTNNILVKYSKKQKELTIVELSESVQWIASSKNTIIFDGNFYNSQELIEEFEVNNEVELLHKLWNNKSMDEISDLIYGRFVFIVYSQITGNLFVVKDHWGITPLYSYDNDDEIIFSSTIEPIITLVKDIIPNDETIYDYLAHHVIDYSSDTFFKGIQTILPATYSMYSGEEIITKHYFDIEKEVKILRKSKKFKCSNTSQHIHHIRELFIDSVLLCMRTDKSIGCSLSGGIDSSSVVSVIDMIPNDMETYSLIFGDWFEKDETKYIDEVISNSNFGSNQITCNIERINNDFETFLHHQEQPVSNLSVFGQWCLIQSVDKEILMSGQAADELLCGYEWMYKYFVFSYLKRLKLISFVKALSHSSDKKQLLKFCISQLLHRNNKKLSYVSTFMDHIFLSKYNNQNTRFQENARLLKNRLFLDIQLANLKGHFQHLLRFEQRSALAFGIEPRIPFLVPELAIYLLAMPQKYKIQDDKTKWIFRESMKGITPTKILERTDKIGFDSPISHWLKDDTNILLLSELQQKIINKEYHHKMDEYIDMEKIGELYNKTRTEQDKTVLFRVAQLEKWLSLFIER